MPGLPLPGAFACIDALPPDGEVLPLLRLRYRGSAHHWGFGLYLASSHRYKNQLLPTGFPIDTPEEAHNALALRRQSTLWPVA